MVEPGTALSSVGTLIVKNLELKQIWLKLQQEKLEEYVNDFFKDCLSKGVLLASPDVLKKSLLEALAQFLKLIEDELLFECELTEAEVRDTYQVEIGRFIRDDEVKPLLGKAFEKDCRGIDANQLRTIWVQRYSPNMPTGFNWDGIAKQYVTEVKRLVRISPELRAMLELEIQESIEQQGRENAGITPDFNLTKYQKGLRDRYSNLNLSSLDTTGCAYNQLKLWRLFIPQYEPSSMREFILVREIRIQAVAAIATTWHDSPDTLPWLKQKAQSDDDSTVRQAAVQELAKGWKDEPWLFELLRDSRSQ
jgi:hypothetical protein